MNWFDEVDYGTPHDTLTVGLEDMTKKTPHASPVFIALSGKKQVGKDTAAGMIVQVLESQGKTAVLTAFAEPLKNMCIDILGLRPTEVYGTDVQKNERSHILWDGFTLNVRLKYSIEIDPLDGKLLPRTGAMTNREVLQVMGTDIFRAIYDPVWAKAPFNRDWGTDVVIITDCRFPNEKSVTEEAGGVIIRIERSTGFKDNHASETALDNEVFENTYQNNGSFDDLENYLRSVLKKYGLIND